MEEDWIARHNRQSEIAQKLIEADPKLDYISAIVIAGDRMSAEDSMASLKSGEISFERALTYVGSFGRLNFVMEALDNGLVERQEVLDQLPELWRGSDPDDTDLRYLELWREAWEKNGSKYIRDGEALPRNKILTVYRGQEPGTDWGIAWSLDQDIATKFARGAGTRQMNRNGMVFKAVVNRKNVLAYLTGRGESEIVVDPFDLEYLVE